MLSGRGGGNGSGCRQLGAARPHLGQRERAARSRKPRPRSGASQLEFGWPRDDLTASPAALRGIRDYFFFPLVDLGEHVAARQDEEVLAVDADLGAAVLRVQDDVADGDVDGDELTGLVGATPGPDGQDFTLLGLLLGGVGDHEPAHGGLFCLTGPDDDPVLERLQVHVLCLLAAMARCVCVHVRKSVVQDR